MNKTMTLEITHSWDDYQYDLETGRDVFSIEDDEGSPPNLSLIEVFSRPSVTPIEPDYARLQAGYFSSLRLWQQSERV